MNWSVEERLYLFRTDLPQSISQLRIPADQHPLTIHYGLTAGKGGTIYRF